MWYILYIRGAHVLKLQSESFTLIRVGVTLFGSVASVLDYCSRDTGFDHN